MEISGVAAKVFYRLAEKRSFSAHRVAKPTEPERDTKQIAFVIMPFVEREESN